MISRAWRVYACFAAALALYGHLGSILGVEFGGTMWHEREPTFVYQQLTFATSTLYIYNCVSCMLTGRVGGDTTKILLCYPIVTLAYFTVFTGFKFWGEFNGTAGVNHLFNQVYTLPTFLILSPNAHPTNLPYSHRSFTWFGSLAAKTFANTFSARASSMWASWSLSLS
jgi:hypothetical protein